MVENPEHLHCDSPPLLSGVPNSTSICQWSLYDHHACCRIWTWSQSSLPAAWTCWQARSLSVCSSTGRFAGYFLSVMESHAPLENMLSLNTRGSGGIMPQSWLQGGPEVSNHHLSQNCSLSCWMPLSTGNVSLREKNSELNQSSSSTSDSKSVSDLEWCCSHSLGPFCISTIFVIAQKDVYPVHKNGSQELGDGHKSVELIHSRGKIMNV